jgi:N-acetylglucosaminyl-diphospho-decaprenol L-rhamnosyltransferase
MTPTTVQHEAAAEAPASAEGHAVPAPADVLVSIVNHRHVDLLPSCLDSISPAAPGLICHVTVLDNASPDGSAEMIRRRYPDVELIAQEEPRGFAANQNAIIGPRVAGARYVLLLNDDACMAEGALSAMVAYMDDHPAVGIAAPRLVYPDGSPQSSFRAFPGALDEVASLWGLGRLVPKGWRRKHPGLLRTVSRVLPRMTRVYLGNWVDVPDQPILVDAVCGACMVVRAEAIRQIGLLDADTFFMYYEDTDWCRRAAAAGWGVAFLPHAVVRHHQQASRSPVTVRAFVVSCLRYFAKHGSAVDVVVLRVAVALKAVALLPGSACGLAFTRTRPAAARSMARVRDLFRLGWKGHL